MRRVAPGALRFTVSSTSLVSMMRYASHILLKKGKDVDYCVSTSHGSTTTNVPGPLMLEGSPLTTGLELVPDLSPKSRWYSGRLSPSSANADSLPQYLIINLGMSENFGDVDLEHLGFPVTMSVDWIRVYQRTDSIDYTCDPPGFPTQAYINTYIEAYSSQCFCHPSQVID